MGKKKNDVDQHSVAGIAGAASRWKDHVKLETTHIRILKNDSDCIGVLSRRFGVAASSIVHCCLVNWRDDFINS